MTVNLISNFQKAAAVPATGASICKIAKRVRRKKVAGAGPCAGSSRSDDSFRILNCTAARRAAATN